MECRLNRLIANAARLVGAGGTIRAVGGVAGWQVDVFARHSAFPAIAANPVNDAAALARPRCRRYWISCGEKTKPSKRRRF